jgi:hypothetical protein
MRDDRVAMARQEDPQRTYRVVKLVEDTLAGLLEMDPEDWPRAEVPEQAALLLDELGSKSDGARDLVLLLLAYCIDAQRPLDLLDPMNGDIRVEGLRIPGDRTASDKQQEALRHLGIQSTSPIRNSSFRAGYASPQVKRTHLIVDFLKWLAEPGRSFDEVSHSFERMAEAVAATAKQVRPLPPIDHTRLTYAALIEFADRLLSEPSGGAYEQYLFAALLEAVLDQDDNRFRVETATLHASDKPTSRVSDVVVRQGQNLIDAYEVTANEWQTKAAKAVSLLANRPELKRINIVARGLPSGPAIAEGLDRSKLPPGVDPVKLDIAVLDLRGEVGSLIARASRHARRHAIELLYGYLIHLQPDAKLVDRVSELVDEMGLGVSPN